jgi:hypothetical protein
MAIVFTHSLHEVREIQSMNGQFWFYKREWKRDILGVRCCQYGDVVRLDRNPLLTARKLSAFRRNAPSTRGVNNQQTNIFIGTACHTRYTRNLKSSLRH